MKYIANPVEVDAFKIVRILLQHACASAEAGIVCGEPESAHTPEAARGDVGMDHKYEKGTWDAEGLGLLLDDGRIVTASPDMTSRMTPVVGDYWVIQSDGYVYLNPKVVFERKYSPAPTAQRTPPWDTFKGPTCKGCYILGTACGTCEKCKWERSQHGVCVR